MSLDDISEDRKIELAASYIRRAADVREPIPEALAYRHAGYSSSGIAKRLDTREDTVESWMDRVAAQYGLSAIEAKEAGAKPEFGELTQDELKRYSEPVKAQWWQRAKDNHGHIPDGLLEGVSIDDSAW
ncbi:hypothetical protein [Natrialbaceae archaeon AArc-T1-2]|uniref:hypothetical protein n=1 Tax=Natrialbaceae archaeon AArc-T1-2 TaxID=3053904 RepID=UPI00255AEA69|nr:hypothetical protein [Natrialbaceae archaeon AArc-T1-2]WIV68334.1 hypothetical protein QQ977_06320 [Natrialbaceae archaeon AArc-T1-2]